MNILVCMKQVPDTQKVKIDPVKNTLVRKGVPSITNPFDESGLECALEIREVVGGEISVLSMGIPDSECILRDALSLGADRAFLLTDRAFAGADTLATSYTLSMAIRRIGPFDLLVFGKQAIDGDTAQVGPGVASILGCPVITFVTGVRSIQDDRIVVERMIDSGREVVSSSFPVALTVVKAKKRLRMPRFTTIIDSFDTRVVRLGADDIDADTERCGLKGSPTRVKKVFSPKQHTSVQYMEGSAAEQAKLLVGLFREKGIVS
jgi:electron transfer flavoprotein beta subunit